MADSSHIVLQRASAIDRDASLLSSSLLDDAVSCAGASGVAAADDGRAGVRYLNGMEIEALLDVDDGCGRAGVLEAGLASAALDLVLVGLPARAREVFKVAMLQRAADDDLARLFGVSLETVEGDLKLALTHCAARLGR